MIYTLLPSGEHQYVIKNAIIPSEWPPVDPNIIFQLDRKLLPRGSSLSVDENAKTLTILSPQYINNLDEIMDRLAGTGSYPYWIEICERDKKSPNYTEGLYKIVFAGEIKVQIFYYVKDIQAIPRTRSLIKVTLLYQDYNRQEFSKDIIVGFKSGKIFTREDNPISIVANASPERRTNTSSVFVINYQKNKEGILKFNELTNLCMCYDLYAMRIFDSKGEYIWEDINNIRGYHYPYLFDFNNDGIDEIIVVIVNHHEAKIVVYSNRIK